MPFLKSLRSVLAGALWLVRGRGLRAHVEGLETELARLRTRLDGLRAQAERVEKGLAQLRLGPVKEARDLAFAAAHHSRLLLERCNYDVEVLGHKMFLDSKDTLRLALNGVYEPFETDLLLRSLNPGDVVIDVGANIGYYTLLFARQVGEKGRVFAFEPDPTNFTILKRNVERNGYRNVVLIQKAVAERTQTLRLYLCETNKGDHRTYDSADGRRWVEVEAVSLDDYFRDHDGTVDLIKMDIQGAEAGAVRGMTGLLRRYPRVKLATEFWPVGLQRAGGSAREFIGQLQDLGFALYHIDEEGQSLGPADVPGLLRTYVPEKENYTNLLCSRGPLSAAA